MTHAHAIVWMDSREAHVFQVSLNDAERERVLAHSPFRKVHHKAGVVGSGHVHLDRHYLDEIADNLHGVEAWLLAGPGAAKVECASYLEQHHPEIWDHLLEIVPADHPSDGELLDQARRAFKRLDRMRPNSPAVRT